MNGNTMLYFARHIWPWVRPFVNKQPRCSRCILPAGDAGPSGDWCPACAQYNPDTHRQAVQTLSPSEYRIPDKDVCLLLSGGKDSAYVLHMLRRHQPDLRIECILVDTGFMSPMAIRNAVSIARETRTDLRIVSTYIDEFRERLRAAFRTLAGGGGSYGVVDFAEGAFIYEIALKVAHGRRVVSGMTHAQLDHIDTGNAGEQGFIFPLDHWRVSETEIQNAGLVEGTPLTTNSQLILPMMICDIKNLGYCSFEPEFAQNVREGKADRRSWLYLFETLTFMVRKGWLDATLDRCLQGLLGLTSGEVIAK